MKILTVLLVAIVTLGSLVGLNLVIVLARRLMHPPQRPVEDAAIPAMPFPPPAGKSTAAR